MKFTALACVDKVSNSDERTFIEHVESLIKDASEMRLFIGASLDYNNEN